MPDINLASTAATGLAADPAHLLAILWRGRRVIAACVAGGLSPPAFYLPTTGRLYQATAKLLILQQGGRPLSVAGGDQGRLADSGEDTIPTHAMVLKSPAVVGRAIES